MDIYRKHSKSRLGSVIDILVIKSFSCMLLYFKICVKPILSKIKPNTLKYAIYVALIVNIVWFGVRIIWGEMFTRGVLFQ